MASTFRQGTFVPGTKVQVGKHRVIVERYLSEGGFAHVYVVKIPRSGGKSDIAVLKRVAVPDKETLANMRTEVETMKKLKGHKYIVTYIDSHASQLKGGGYEVFLLMEYCAGGGLIDFMNTRLQHRLTEPEILKIFSDVTEGVAGMHYLEPPLLHRDLKVENVLISTSGASKHFKICDFGSAANPTPAVKTAAEGRILEDDIQRHTTLQYRSPEMIDVYRGHPVDEKSDIWALGVLLYKLCYYTTPFENRGQMAILNATFQYPSAPLFSNRTKKLIAWMLQEKARSRPNIYQVIEEVCLIRGTKVLVGDIYSYSRRTRLDEQKRISPAQTSVNEHITMEKQKASPLPQSQTIPDVTRMRRGRPANKAQGINVPSNGSSSVKSDPFAALDSTSEPVRSAAMDELASRFPSLDEFSLLHENGSKFEFSRAGNAAKGRSPVDVRRTEDLANKAFVKPSATSSTYQSATFRPQFDPKPSNATDNAEKTWSSQESHKLPVSSREPPMVSTCTTASQLLTKQSSQDVDAHRNPQSDQLLANPKIRIDRTYNRNSASLSKEDIKPEILKPHRPQLLSSQRSKSYINTKTTLKSPASSRPSLESKRQNEMDFEEPISRSHSLKSNMRPSSMHLNSSLDYLRDRENTNSRVSLGLPHSDSSRGPTPPVRATESTSELRENNINSDIAFLRVIEDDDSAKKRSRQVETRRSTKRSSLPASLSNTKNLLAGKFGDAFRKFEGNNAETQHHVKDINVERAYEISHVESSDTVSGHVEIAINIDETEELVPEVRRELERMRMIQEEKRVSDAAAAYRDSKQHSRNKPKPFNSSKAATIQNRVNSLLHDSDGSHSSSFDREARSSPPKAPTLSRPLDRPSPVQKGFLDTSAALDDSSTRLSNPKSPLSDNVSLKKSPEAPLTLSATQASKRPNAPPKPDALRTGSQINLLTHPAVKPINIRKDPPVKPPALKGKREVAEDWEINFNKRYPSLTGLDMVEMEIGKAPVIGLPAKNL